MSLSKKAEAFLKTLQDPAELDFRKTLVYGPSRAGKTEFLASAGNDERTSPMMILDFEGGSVSAKGFPGVKIRRIRTWEEYDEVYEFLANDNVQAGEPIFRSVSIDSVSETHFYSIRNIVDHENETVKRRKEAVGGPDPNTVEEADYGKSLMQMRLFLRRFRDLPLHTFFTSLPKSVSVPKEGSVRVPAVFGQLAEDLVGMFDVTAYLSTSRGGDDSVTRVLVLQNYPGIRAGVRLARDQKIPDEIEIQSGTGVTQLFDVLQVPKK